MALEDGYIIRRIQNQVERGINSESGDVTDVRQAMFSRYMGEQYGNERDGHSKVTTRQGLEAVEWTLPSLLRIFMGGRRVVSFRANGPDDVQQAKHETDVVNQCFADGAEDSGFVVLYSWLKDILMYPNGYIKISVHSEEDKDQQSFTEISPEMLDVFKENKEITDIAIDRTYRIPGQTMPGIPATPITVHDITITRTTFRRQIRVAPVPPDSVIIDHNHARLDLDSSPFICLRERKTRSELIQEGYDRADLEDLSPHDDEALWNSENTTRHFYVDEEPEANDDEYDLKADETFWVHECYMQIDYDEDDVNELRHIVMAGCKILDNEEQDYNPVVAASAIPMPHKHIGMGYMEIVTDLQDIFTTLTRQLLDNIYKNNVGRKYVSEQALLSDNTTMDQILDGRNEVVVVRGDPNTAIMPEVTPSIIGEIVQVMEVMKDSPQMRTGVAPQLALDPSVLEKSTMGAFMAGLDQASQRLELLARLFAETAFVKVFQKTHYLLRTYFDKPMQMEIGGKWVEVNPSQWRKRSNMTVNVGLGFNNKQAMLGLLSQLLMMQREAMALGLADEKKIYATFAELIEHTNLGHVGTYFNDPNDPEFKAPPPKEDPAMISAKAQAQALAAEAKRQDMIAGREQDRKDAEHKAKLGELKEKSELEAAKVNHQLLELKSNFPLLQAQIAKITAEITALNRGDKNQGGPAEDSSEDEFSRAAGMTGDGDSEKKAA